MRQYRFTAVVTLDPAADDADDDAARCGPSGTLACCLVEPSGYSYFPAVISMDTELPPRTAAYALVIIALHDSEAGAFFAPGQRFTIWADAVVGHTVQAAGLIGYGVICQCTSPSAPCASRGTAAGTAAYPAPMSDARRYQPCRRRHAHRRRPNCPHSR